jgi:hypothetical protein
MGEPESPPPGTRTASLVMWLALALTAVIAILAWLFYATGRLPVR